MTQIGKLKAPFPYFGGKSTVAAEVWRRFGDVRRYIEPFFGSGAVLLARPGEPPFGYEIINDFDGNVANFWRSVQFEPDEVAKWCDWPCNHIDLHARRLKLIKEYEEMRQRLMADDTWCNPKLAGYWCWCLSNWIGCGLMEVRKRDEEIIKRPQATHDIGVICQLPQLTAASGVNRIAQAPPAQYYTSVKNRGGNLSSANSYLESGNHSNKSVECRSLSPAGELWGGDISAKYPAFPKPNPWSAGSAVTATMRQLQDRLRAVKVVCGDWSQVCGGSWQDSAGICGVFFDPPYSAEDRSAVYANESFTVAHDVRQWCLRRGDNPLMRIALCGYDMEHTELEAAGWKVYEWQTQGGYANQGSDTRGRKNAKRERIWFSPHCLKAMKQQELDFE